MGLNRETSRVRDDARLSLLDGLLALPPRVARRYEAIPLRYDDGRLVVGVRRHPTPRLLATLQRLGHSRVTTEPISEARFRQVMNRWYGPAAAVSEYVSDLERRSPGDPWLQKVEQIETTPAPRFLELTLAAALAEQASDVHIELTAQQARVRFRIDGLLRDRIGPPPWLAERVIGRVKALAGLALGECLFAQEGHFDFPTASGPVAVRVSILPCDRGECAVLRLLTVEDAVPSLEELGMPAELRRVLVDAVGAPDGLIVFAGPTGSGKSTTLHSLLETADADGRNIVSIEEPVEIRSRRIRQVPVRRGVGLDFAGALRVVLRQDPDIILVGETRDRETAELVIQASLAGHLVLTTVHAADALRAFDRLAQLGADRALLGEVTRVSVSQRLLRRRCSHCQGAGCFSCEGSGLRGRIGLFELVEADLSLSAAIGSGASGETLKSLATAAGFRSFEQWAGDLVESGLTTWDEVARVLDLEHRVNERRSAEKERS